MCMTSTVLLCHLLATKWIRRPQSVPRAIGSSCEASSPFRPWWRSCWSSSRLGRILWLPVVVQSGALGGHHRLARVPGQSVYHLSTGTQELHAGGIWHRCRGWDHADHGDPPSLCRQAAAVTTPYVKNFPTSNALLIFQLALIVGTFMIGLCFRRSSTSRGTLHRSPRIASAGPDKRDLHRRLLAAFFYLFATLYVVGCARYVGALAACPP